MTSLLLLLLLCGLARPEIVQETLRFTWDEGAPNGQARNMIFTNGQFPGPSLIWNEDDDVEVSC